MLTGLKLICCPTLLLPNLRFPILKTNSPHLACLCGRDPMYIVAKLIQSCNIGCKDLDSINDPYQEGDICENCWNTKINLLKFLKVLKENDLHYYMPRQIWAFWLVLSWLRFCHTNRFCGWGHMLRIFCFRKPANSKQVWPECHTINYLLNLASSSSTGECWPLVIFVWTSLCSVRTAMTSGQYSAVCPSRWVSKRPVFWA